MKIVVFLLAIIGIMAGTYLVSQNQNYRRQAAPSSSLYINPNTLTINTNQNFNLDVMVDSPSKRINGVDIRIKFDPTAFEIISIVEGSKTSRLDNVIADQTKIDNQNGLISFVAFSIDKTKTVNGSKIKILTISGRSKNKSGSYNVNFTDQTQVTAIDESENIISLVSGSEITIQSTGPGPVETPISEIWKTGDVNRDGLVNVIDIGILIDNYNLPISNPLHDINSDDAVNIIDIGIVIDNYGL